MQQTLFPTNNRCQVTLEDGTLILRSPYIRDLVHALKSLPYAERRWDGTRKVWLIDPKHGQQLAGWITQYVGETVTLPNITTNQVQPVMKLLEVRYIGTCKTRDDGTNAAFGLVGSDWSIIFPESVLRTWFEGGLDPAEPPSAEQTLYQVLGIKKAATDDEIKTAYRRMAKQWHPDVCKEPNAAEIFVRIQETYELLSNANKRARYDAGLFLQRAYEKQSNQSTRSAAGYRSPLRCGVILLEGIEKVGRLEVDKILQWEDVVKNGKTLVVSWPLGAKAPVERWV